MEGLFLAYESAFMVLDMIGQDQALSATAFQRFRSTIWSFCSTIDRCLRCGEYLLININGQVVYSVQPNSYGHFWRGTSAWPLEHTKETLLEECFQSSMKSDGKNVPVFDFKYYPQVQRTMSFFSVSNPLLNLIIFPKGLKRWCHGNWLPWN